MTKLAIFGRQTFLAGIVIVIAAGAKPAQSHSTATANERGGLSLEPFNDYPELLEYFESGEETEEKENENEGQQQHPSSPIPHPIFFVEESIWKKLDDGISENNNNESNTNTNSNIGNNNNNNNNNNNDNHSDSNHYTSEQSKNRYRQLFDQSVNDIQFNQYNNYQKEETREHDEELITDDPYMDSWVDPPTTSLMESTGSWETTPPTSPDSSLWDGLDAYADDDHSSDEDSNSTDEDSNSSDEDSSSTDSTSTDHLTDTDILLGRPTNSMALTIVMGVVHGERMNSDEDMDILNIAIRTVTEVIHKNLPFVVIDNIDNSKRERERELRPTVSSSHDDNELQPQPQLRDAGFDGILPSDISMNDSEKKERLATLVLENIVVKYSLYGWWHITMIYTVWKTNPRLANGGRRRKRARDLQTGESESSDESQQQQQQTLYTVKSRNILKKVEGIVCKAIEKSIEQEEYWETLKSKYGNHDLVLPLKKKMYANTDKGMADVQAVGDEYNLWDYYCPSHKNRFYDVGECIPGSEPYAPPDGSRASNDDPLLPKQPVDFLRNATYPDVIASSFVEIEWKTREWVGAVLMLLTLLWAGLLSLTAHIVSNRQDRKRVWGAPALTQQGVDDILNVGWRVYEQQPAQGLAQQPPPTPPQEQQQQQQPAKGMAQGDHRDFQQQPQLFLQIYDKGQGQGYNDENSMLQGGVEQQLFAPHTAAGSAPPPTPEPLPNYHPNNANGTNHPS